VCRLCDMLSPVGLAGLPVPLWVCGWVLAGGGWGVCRPLCPGLSVFWLLLCLLVAVSVCGPLLNKLMSHDAMFSLNQCRVYSLQLRGVNSVLRNEVLSYGMLSTAHVSMPNLLLQFGNSLVINFKFVSACSSSQGPVVACFSCVLPVSCSLLFPSSCPVFPLSLLPLSALSASCLFFSCFFVRFCPVLA